MWGCFSRVQLFAILWTVACQASRSVGFSRQQYWSGLPYPSRALFFLLLKPPLPLSTWRCQGPATQAPAPLPHLILTEADPSPPGQPQEQMPVDDPHTEVKMKSQLKPMGSVDKEEDSNPSHQLYKLQVKSTQSTRQTLSMEYIKGHWELPQKKTHLFWQLWTVEARTHRSKTRSKFELVPQHVQRPAQCWRAS